MKKLLLILLVGCGDNIVIEPDASIHEVDIPPSVGTRPDASIDAPDVSICWVHATAHCNGMDFEVCVPYHGCVTFECDGQTIGYCGPY